MGNMSTDKLRAPVADSKTKARVFKTLQVSPVVLTVNRVLMYPVVACGLWHGSTLLLWCKSKNILALALLGFAVLKLSNMIPRLRHEEQRAVFSSC